MKNIIIAGGGFAGVRLARKLRKNKDVHVTLINNSPVFRYSPALYRAVTGFKLGVARIPLEWMLLDTPNITLKIGEVTSINSHTKSIIVDDKESIEYDKVVFALGSVTTFFGIPGLHEYSYGVKSPEEVSLLKQHIHSSLIHENKDHVDFVVIGAGPTGVELAGALGVYLRQIAKRHRVNNSNIGVHLIEAGPRILPQMGERAAKMAHKRLTKLQVNISTNTVVKSESKDSLKTSLGSLKTDNVIWTAGTANNPFFAKHPEVFTFDKRGKVIVNEHLQVARDIYVCGDNASTPYSGLAFTAVKHADYIANDLRKILLRKSRSGIKARVPIQVVPVDSKFAVLQYRKISLGGRTVGILRRMADIVGYTDVLGYLRAFTIWSNDEATEESCTICK